MRGRSGVERGGGSFGMLKLHPICKKRWRENPPLFLGAVEYQRPIYRNQSTPSHPLLPADTNGRGNCFGGKKTAVRNNVTGRSGSGDVSDNAQCHLAERSGTNNQLPTLYCLLLLRTF